MGHKKSNSGHRLIFISTNKGTFQTNIIFLINIFLKYLSILPPTLHVLLECFKDQVCFLVQRDVFSISPWMAVSASSLSKSQPHFSHIFIRAKARDLKDLLKSFKFVLFGIMFIILIKSQDIKHRQFHIKIWAYSLF